MLVLTLLAVGPKTCFAQLAPAWNDCARSLAGKIAAGAAPAHNLALSVENVSSLDDADAAAVEQALRSELAHRGLRIVPATEAEVRVSIALSEGIEGYIWTAQIERNGEQGNQRQVAIVAAPRLNDEPRNHGKQNLTLSRRLVWEQREKLLDFAVLPSVAGGRPAPAGRDVAAGSGSWLVALDPDKIAFYEADDPDSQDWRSGQTIPIPHSAPWPRDLWGSIHVAAGQVELPGVECSVTFAPPQTAACASSAKEERVTAAPVITGQQEGDSVEIESSCGTVTLVTGTGDWMQPDTVEAYQRLNGKTIAASEPLETAGPVMSLQQEETPGMARLVVHNLKTGNYEGYILSVDCGR